MRSTLGTIWKAHFIFIVLKWKIIWFRVKVDDEWLSIFKTTLNLRTYSFKFQ